MLHMVAYPFSGDSAGCGRISGRIHRDHQTKTMKIANDANARYIKILEAETAESHFQQMTEPVEESSSA